jgi:hypothetical protein
VTDPLLATLSTIAWLVVTSVLFVELANWSAGGSWSIIPGLVRGARSWVDRRQESDLPQFAVSPRGALPAHSRAAWFALPASSTEAPHRTYAPDSPVRAPVPALGSPILTGWEPAWPAADDEPRAELIELDHSEL